jgi:hypothetical protein
VFHKASESHSGFAQVTSDHSVVPNDQQWQSELTCDCFRERRFPVTRRASKEHSVSRLDRVRTKKVGPLLFLDKLRARRGYVFRQNEIRQHPFRAPLVVRPDRRIGGRSARIVDSAREVLGESIGDDVMLPLTLLRNHRLDRATKADLVPEGPGTDEVEEQV